MPVHASSRVPGPGRAPVLAAVRNPERTRACRSAAAGRHRLQWKNAAL